MIKNYYNKNSVDKNMSHHVIFAFRHRDMEDK